MPDVYKKLSGISLSAVEERVNAQGCLKSFFIWEEKPFRRIPLGR